MGNRPLRGYHKHTNTQVYAVPLCAHTCLSEQSDTSVKPKSDQIQHKDYMAQSLLTPAHATRIWTSFSNEAHDMVHML